MPDMGRGIIAPANSDNIGTGASEMRTLASTAATAIGDLESQTAGALDGKANTSHTHPVSDVDGLGARLDALETTQSTGLRNISGMFPEVVFQTGQSMVSLSRVANIVQVSLYGIRFDAAAAFHHFSSFLPTGFRPLAGTLLIVPILQGDTSVIRFRVVRAGQMTVYDHNGASLLYGSATYATDDAWPATLPGVPA